MIWSSCEGTGIIKKRMMIINFEKISVKLAMICETSLQKYLKKI